MAVSAAPGTPPYSVVVPAYQAARTIGACLDALLAQTVPTSAAEIIVVDDGSTDGTGALAAGFGVRVLRVPHGGAAAARNAGTRAARGPIVLFTDADCRPRPGWAGALLAALADPRLSGARGRYATRQGGLIPRFVQAEYEEKYARLARRATVDFVDTYAAAYRREVLLAAGGFDERFGRATVEDQELSFRLAAAGHRFAYVPEAIVEHRHPERLAAYAARKYRIAIDKAALLRDRPGRWRGDDHTPRGQQLQMVALLPLLLAAPGLLDRRTRRPALLALLPFALSAAPFVWRTRRDPGLALGAPALLLVRAGALTAGLLRGQIGRRGGGAGTDAPVRLAPTGDATVVEVALPLLLASGKAVVLAGPQGPPPGCGGYPGKRALDLALAALLGLAALPLLLGLAILIRLDSPGPIVLRQERIGRGGRIFGMYKLRTMRADAALRPGHEALRRVAGGVVFDKPRADPRVTRVGRWLRRSALDELPQLWNVLRGEMSLVGPRPDLPIESVAYTPAHWRRLAVRPGMTGPWQARGRGRPDPPAKLAADLGYAESATLRGDLRLLAETIGALLGGAGTY